ncbi:AGAP006722-PA [Anopheles gambiae str. PEST]|uniref:AGAP006722-PA n=4 Tax=gambiae species complex TaxID=44542 RepID=Q5TWE5_ANOGA|nr:cecropin-B1-like [Anopheles coluzzii]EAL41975.2 AGAP006722-PA [Anopheles gambiae str. PEST]
MNVSKLFVIVLLATLLLFGGQAEAGHLKKFGKKLEKVGKNVFHAVEKVVPVLQGIQDLRDKKNGQRG